MTLTPGDVAALARQAVDMVSLDIDVNVDPESLDDPYRMGSSSWLVWPLVDKSQDFAIRLSSNMNPDEALGRLIDGLSGGVSETRRFWGVPFPACPGHPHPALVGEPTGETVTLVCPATQGIVAEVQPEI